MKPCSIFSQKKKVNSIHLALSLNSNYWPEQSEALLFDSGSHGDAISLLSGGFSIAPSPWTINTDIDVVSKINVYYESLLQTISEAFNELFNERNSIHFYRILLGPTLYWMLNVFYDRYWRIRVIYDQFPNIKLPVNNKDHIFVNIYDFVVAAKESEFYNAKIINYIKKKINAKDSYNFPHENNRADFKRYNPSTYKNNKIRNCKGYIIDELTKNFPSFFKKTHIIFYKLNFNISLFDRLRYKVFLTHNDIFSSIPINKLSGDKKGNMREALHALIKKYNKFTNDDFLELFLEFFAYELPLSFLEHHDFYNSCAKKQQQKYPMEIICSSIGWYFDEPFKYFSAWAVERGAKLVGFQHGGNYQILKEHFVFEHEKKITDFYFTLGEIEKKQERSDVYFSEKFAVKCNHEINEENILFVSTSPCKFLIEFPCVTEKSDFYIKNQIAFINELQERGVEDLIYRPYHIDHVWNLTKAVKNFFPKVKIDLEPSFSLSICSAKLAIFDHLSTTFLESLARNKPTILCWSEEMYCINESSERQLNDLIKAKILHHCYEEAVDTVQLALSIGVEQWWRDSKRQASVNKFLTHFISGSLGKDTMDKSSFFQKINKYVKIPSVQNYKLSTEEIQNLEIAHMDCDSYGRE